MNSSFLTSWSPSTIFSPTSRSSPQQSDLTYLHTLLAPLFAPHPVPPFEPTPEVIHHLLTLAAHIESSSTLANNRLSLKATALESIIKYKQGLPNDDTPERLLVDSMPPEGQHALHALALGFVAADAESVKGLARRTVGLAGCEADASISETQVQGIQRRLELEQERASRVREGLAQTLTLDSDKDLARIESELASRTVEWTRTSRQVSQKSSEYMSYGELLQVSTLPPSPSSSTYIPS